MTTMMKSEVYSRKISSSEAKEGHIMILKSSLSFFPFGGAFDLVSGNSTKKVKVESYHCECRGPAEPHEHYFIVWPALNAGDVVIIEKDARRPRTYRLKVRSQVAQKGFCG
jgi:hypothetical protein